MEAIQPRLPAARKAQDKLPSAQIQMVMVTKRGYGLLLFQQVFPWALERLVWF